jgi:predicted nucleic acid-binding protein
MTDIAVDASVSVMIVIPEPFSPQAIALFRDAQLAQDRLAAPYVLPIEVTNAIRRHMRRADLTIAAARHVLDRFLVQPIDLLISHELHRQALRLAAMYSLGGHDAHYVALAQLLDCELWTADERILRATSGQLPFVRFIGDYVSPGGTPPA